MLLNVNDIRKLNAKSPELSYMIIEKCIEKFFTDLLRYNGVLNQKYIILDSTYLPYQYLSIEIIEKIIDLLEKQLGYAIIIQKLDNSTYNGYKKGDLIQIMLFDPLNYDEEEVNIKANSVNCQTLYSTFNSFNNLDGKYTKISYLDCKEFNYMSLNSAKSNVINLQEKVSQNVEVSIE